VRGAQRVCRETVSIVAKGNVLGGEAPEAGVSERPGGGGGGMGAVCWAWKRKTGMERHAR